MKTMKKTIFFALAAALFASYSCVNDRGNYDYAEPGAFFVDTTGLTADMTRSLVQFEELAITPNLVFEGDESQLEHTWLIYRDAYEQKSEPVPEQFNGGPTLALPMAYNPDKYYVQYVAHDPASDRSAQMRWRVELTAADAVGSGLLVYYREDGLGDCDLIKTSLFDVNVTEDEVARNLYSTANPSRPITSELVACGSYDILDLGTGATGSWITLLWADGGGRLNFENMTLSDNLRAFTLEDTPITAPTFYSTRYDFTYYSYGYFMSKNVEIMINDGKAYVNPLYGVMYMGPLGVNDGSSYRATHAIISTWGPNRIFWDAENKRFLCSPYNGGILSPVNANSEPYFDFDNVNKEMIAMDHGFGPEVAGNASTGYGVMRNLTDDGKRYLYIWQMTANITADFTQSGILDISGAPAITSAEHFAFSNRGPVMFYAGGDMIGQIEYNHLATPWSYSDSKQVWTAPMGEVITSMKFMKYPGVGLTARADDKYLLVATWNATTSEGKVHVLETNVSSGALVQQEPVATYSGFGRIKDMCYKAY